MTSRAAIWSLAAMLPALAYGASVASSFRPRCGGAAAPFDLDLALPPGTPLDITRSLPHTPVGPPPRTPSTPNERHADGTTRTQSTPLAVGAIEAPPSSFGLLRILTWDLTAHVGWLGQLDRPEHTFTRGGGELAYPPVVRRPYWWMTMAPLLRLLLHPQLVSAAETRAHLIELGEAALPALEGARSEPALELICAEVIARIGRPDASAPVPLRDNDPDRAMWLRFAAEQLVERHPHDPELGFGEKLYLFGERIVPAVAAYLEHDHAFLRRNAVVALERLGGRVALDALMHLVPETSDPVQWCRAVMALGRRRHPPAMELLAKQLAEEREPWRAAVLIHALGLIGDARAAAPIAKRAVTLYRDSDLVMAALVALARLPQREAPKEVRVFLDQVRAESPSRWQREPPPPDYIPDRPDANDARHAALQQLERIARSACTPSDEGVANELFDWLGTPEATAHPSAWERMESSNGTLARVHPPARLVYLEQLARCGDRGRSALLDAARDAKLDPQLRAYALRFVASTERAELAAQLARDLQTDGALRVAAIEILAGLRSRNLDAIALEIAKEVLAVADLEALDGAARFLLRRAIEVLGSAGSAESGAAELLLAWAGRGGIVAPPTAKLEDALRAQVVALVAVVAEKGRVAAAKREIEDVLDIVISKHLSPVYREENRAEARGRLQALLEGLRARHEAPYRDTVAEAITNELLGRVIGSTQAAIVFAPRVPLDDVLCFELARCGRNEALLALVRRLRDPQASGRGVAALALGGVASRVVLPHLLAALDDRDAFVRLCAAAALERRTGAKNACDWWTADAAARAAGIASWRSIAEKG